MTKNDQFPKMTKIDQFPKINFDWFDYWTLIQWNDIEMKSFDNFIQT